MESIPELTKLIKDSEASLLRYAGSLLRNREDARDVIQEVFIRYVKTVREGTVVNNAQAWLFRAARNKCYDLLRSKRREMEMLLDEDVSIADFADNHETPDKEIARLEIMQLIRQQINKLKPRNREVVILKIEHNKSYKEIAEILDITSTNVGFILHQSIKEIADSVKSHLRGSVTIGSKNEKIG